MSTTTKSNRFRDFRRAFLAGLVYSIFFVLAFPPFSWWGMAFLIPVPLFMLVRATPLKPWQAAIFAAIGSLPSWGYVHLWVADVSQAGVIPLVIMMAGYTFLFVWLATRITRGTKRDWIVLPIAWVGVEFFRGSLLWGGYPWYLTAHPLIDSPFGILAMPASIFGVYFVSFLCSLYSILLIKAVFSTRREDRFRSGIYAGGVFTLWIIIGALLIPGDNPTAKSIRVGVIQPNIPQDNRAEWTVRQRVRDWLNLRDLTIAAANDPKNPESLDLIVWPEGFVPGWTLDPVSLATEREENLAWTLTPRSETDVPSLTGLPSKISATMIVDEMLIMQRALNIPMIVGSVAFDNLQILDTPEGIKYDSEAMYNSAFVLNDGEPQPVWYDKIHLTPFGEVMPYISTWSWLESQLLSIGAEGMAFALDSGKESRVLSVPVERETDEAFVQVATPICFEATISHVCRDLVFQNGKRRAAILINLTNDGWFGASDAGRRTHILAARWRCVELATPMIRSANTGFSCVIGTNGEILSETITPLHLDPREGHLIVDVVLGQGTSFYSRIGDLFGWLSFGAMLVLVLKPIVVK